MASFIIFISSFLIIFVRTIKYNTYNSFKNNMIEPLLVWWTKNNVTNANFGSLFAIKSFCFIKIGSKSKKLEEFFITMQWKIENEMALQMNCKFWADNQPFLKLQWYLY